MHKPLTQKTGGQVIWHNAQILPELDERFFDLDWHQSQGGVLGRAAGRGAAHFLRYEGYDLVLRAFRRGGLMGKINADRFLRLGAKHSRGFQEFELLGWMRAQGLPVPNPVAARFVPTGLWYRADIVMELIPQSRTLAEVVAEQSLSPEVWSNIGAVIRQMHDLGVHHSDLNCRNILLDAGMQVWLIDFDKCWRREQGPWQGQNLERLHRSLEKEQTKVPGLHWRAADWAALQQGYGA